MQGKTKTRAKKLVEEFICRFGAPYAIHSDQGRDFESNLLKEVGALFDSKKQRTAIRVITKLPNSEQSYKGKVKTHNYISRQNQSTTGKL